MVAAGEDSDPELAQKVGIGEGQGGPGVGWGEGTQEESRGDIGGVSGGEETVRDAG